MLRRFLVDGSEAFSSVLTVKEVMRLIGEEVIERGERIFTPLVTLSVFLRQVHSEDGSCRAAVAQYNAERVAQGQKPCSARTGGYCKARQRLPERLLERLVKLSGERLTRQTPASWHWYGRSVKLVDGSAVSMPDTPANQEAYPQHSRQARGCGFPTARLVVVLSLGCGATFTVHPV